LLRGIVAQWALLLVRYIAIVTEPHYYTTADAGRDLQVSRQRVHQLLNDGVLRGRQDPATSRWEVERESVLSYLSQRAALSQPRRLAALEALLSDLARRVGALEEARETERRLTGELRRVREELVRLARAVEGEGLEE